MITLVTGGSGSGKSEFAEKIAVYLKKTKNKDLIYLATMMPFGKETLLKIKKHQEMRKNKGFSTIEVFSEFKKFSEKYNFNNKIILLECMSNLIANEMFSDNNTNVISDVIYGIKNISKNENDLIIVTNEVFSDGLQYDNETIEYIKNLGNVNCEISNFADNVIEVVYGIPLNIKGGVSFDY